MSFMENAAKSVTKPPKREAKMHWYPFWSPRFWHGMRLGQWLRLLAENRCRVAPLRWPMAGLITLFTPFNSTMARVQSWRYGAAIEQTTLPRPPLFIIGHWRSGTTYLHELLSQDTQFTCPNTFQCFAPEHFLVTGRLLARVLGFLLPRQRPMDDVKAGWERPQEDEFALLTLGARSPYRRMAFPNNGPVDLDYLDMDALDQTALDAWQTALASFVKALTLDAQRRGQADGRIVLKSPTHTGRIHVLSRLFPGAQFIHVTRHPYSIFPSTCRLWKSLDTVQGLQVPHGRDLEEYALAAFERMYAGFFGHASELDGRTICDVRYEDLVAAPVDSLQRIYSQLELGDFEKVRPALAHYADQQRSYKTNQYDVAPPHKAAIRQRWAEYFARYDYDPDD